MADLDFVIGFATTNPHKLRETEACLQAFNPRIRLVPLPPSQAVEETGATFQENARIKLQASLQEPLPDEVTHVIAEDAGLIIQALDGRYGLSPFPGICSDRWFSEAVQQELFGKTFDSPSYLEKNQAILKLMENVTPRKARYEACVSCWSRETGDILDVTGWVQLEVARSPQGENGFGYDPIMIPVEVDPNRTMAQLSAGEKNQISHRYRALAQLYEKL